MGVGTVGERQSAGCNRSGQTIKFLKEFFDLHEQTIDFQAKLMSFVGFIDFALVFWRFGAKMLVLSHIFDRQLSNSLRNSSICDYKPSIY